jgi:pimeloyl-ACP methyl ester carboxylesterase
MGGVMAKTLAAFFFLVVPFFTMVAHGAQAVATGMWEKKEMDPRVGTSLATMDKIESVSLLPAGAPDPGDPNCNTSETCTFGLFYTTGAMFNLNKEGKLNILFIPGGPGQFVNEGQKEEGQEEQNIVSANEVLNQLAFGEKREGDVNVVYFHVRGTGQSSINRSNNYDKFLRAKYVIEDIERLRVELLKDKPWDAIYAHSWGTIVAQLYASKFGKDPERRVRSLILSAPVVRTDPKTIDARVRQTVTNLADIYKFFRPTGDCVIVIPDEREPASYLKNRVFDFELNPAVGDDLKQTDNLCFISGPRATKITRRVANILKALDKDYGSMGFVVDYFSEVEADLPSDLKKFPIEFFGALRQLQFLGAPKEEGLLFTADAKAMIDAALVIAFHLTPGVGPSGQINCDPAGKFFVGAAADPDVKKEYCKRLIDAKEKFSLGPDKHESIRAKYVLGTYDGVSRWVFNVLGKQKCFTGKDLIKFANAGTGRGDKKRAVRDLTKRIGAPSKDEAEVCGWDPGGQNAHSVPTLILAGTSDAIIAGCQAEDFYNRGLLGQKGFLQFPGQGHGMTITTLVDLPPEILELMPALDDKKRFQQTTNLANLIKKFIKTAVSNPSESGEFLNSVEPERNSVKARTPALKNGNIPCP